MTFSFNNIFVVIIIILKTIESLKALNALRSDSGSGLQSSPNNDQNNGQPIQSQQSLSSQSIYDTLLSIDERIRLLEAYDNTYKLTRIDFTLEQLTQRIVSIESKLSRFESVLDSKIDKIQEVIVSSGRKEEFKTESLNRKLDELSDRFELKSTQIDAKVDSKSDKVFDKLESMERYMHLISEEVLEKLIKYEERHTVFESHVKSHIINIENLVKHSLDANTNIKEIVSYGFESVDKLVISADHCQQQHHSVISRLTSIDNQLKNFSSLTVRQSVSQEHRYDSSGLIGESKTMQMQNELNNTTDPKARAIEEQKIIYNRDIYDNISSTLEQLRQLGVNERLTQLDVHIDYFSRKIINIIQEIWSSSQSSERYFREALDMANKSRSFIRQEFIRLHELIDPMTKTDHFSQLREPLEQRLYQLSTTIDDSFNALMVSQNSFISSCNRIQEEEEQLYDVLDDMLIEIRNKSSLEVSTIKESIEGLKTLFNESMTRLETQMKTIKDRIIDEIKDKIHSNGDKYLTPNSEECFLTRNQLISVCKRSENNVKTNGETNEEKFETNYEDLTQTD